MKILTRTVASAIFVLCFLAAPSMVRKSLSSRAVAGNTHALAMERARRDRMASTRHKLSVKMASIPGEVGGKLSIKMASIPKEIGSQDQPGDFRAFVAFTGVFRGTQGYSTQEYKLPAPEKEFRTGIDRDAYSRRFVSAAEKCNTLGLYLMARQNIAEAEVVFKRGLQYARPGRYDDTRKRLLLNLGIAYISVNQPDAALSNLSEALTIAHAKKNYMAMAFIYDAQGGAYQLQGRDKEAILAFENALESVGKLGKGYSAFSNQFRISAFNNVATSYLNRKELDPAAKNYSKALQLARKYSLPSELQMFFLSNLGAVYRSQGKNQQALDQYYLALALDSPKFNSYLRGVTFNNIMLALNAHRTPSMAIMFGKKAVSVFEQFRKKNAGLDPKSQVSVLEAVHTTYRRLAEILIQQHRFYEAEAVLNLLKIQEYKNYLDVERSGEALDLFSTAEHDFDLRIQESARKKGMPLGPVLEKLEVQSVSNHKIKPDQIKAASSYKYIIQHALNRGFGKAALVYTVANSDHYQAVVITGDDEPAAFEPKRRVTAEEISGRVSDLRLCLKYREFDPRPAGDALRQIVMCDGDLEDYLHAKQIDCIIWQLDGDLRYVPMAALYNMATKKYLVEEFQQDTITLVSYLWANEKFVREQWKVLGLGVSEASEVSIGPAKATVDLDPLEGVSDELYGIVDSPQGGRQKGVLQGTVRMNKEFKYGDIDIDRDKAFKIVHIASHFVLGPDPGSSFLLVGNGAGYPLSRVKQYSRIFDDADLVTLSACETGPSSVQDGGGQEVDSFAIIVQDKGVKSVVSSLWAVPDLTTPSFMRDFYERAKTDGLAVSLRSVQLDCLKGHLSVTANPDVGPAGTKTDTRGTQLPSFFTKQFKFKPFVPDPKAPYAHPYYWAAFTLTGNWQ